MSQSFTARVDELWRVYVEGVSEGDCPYSLNEPHERQDTVSPLR